MELDVEGEAGGSGWIGFQPPSVNIMEHVRQGHRVDSVGAPILHVVDQC